MNDLAERWVPKTAPYLGSHHDAVTAEILDGLQAPQKFINPRFFYDEAGGQLFEQITATDEYYLTRAENEILADCAQQITDRIGPVDLLVEPGAGACRKVELLLPAMRPRAYLPMDVEREGLQAAAARLRRRFPELRCHPVVATFDALRELRSPGRWRRLIFFPGSTLGNFSPDTAADFLRDLRRLVAFGGGLLIGIDLDKSEDLLTRAYNDRAGVTARFNLNVLNHVNRLTGSDFDSRKFRHLARYNAASKCIDMYLCSEAEQSITIADVNIHLRHGEKIHTESSYKYSTSDFERLANRAGLSVEHTWHDKNTLFSLHYLTAA